MTRPDCERERMASISAWNLETWLVEPGHESPRIGSLSIDGNGTTGWVDANGTVTTRLIPQPRARRRRVTPGGAP